MTLLESEALFFILGAPSLTGAFTASPSGERGEVGVDGIEGEYSKSEVCSLSKQFCNAFTW